MTAEKVTTSRATTSRLLRNQPTVFHSVKASAKQARAASSVMKGARWRRARATKSARGAWCRKGRMMKAGIKKKAMAARAQMENKAQIQREGWRCVGWRPGRRSAWCWTSGVGDEDVLMDRSR